MNTKKIVDWSALLDQIDAPAPSKALESGFVPPVSGNISEAVGTFSSSHLIVSNDVFCSVPTVPTVPPLLEEHGTEALEKPIPYEFKKPDGGEVEGQSAPHKSPVETSCGTCAHLCRPGLSDGHCGGRDDLPPAYTPGHPLRQLPDDGGANCSAWRLHPFR